MDEIIERIYETIGALNAVGVMVLDCVYMPNLADIEEASTFVTLLKQHAVAVSFFIVAIESGGLAGDNGIFRNPLPGPDEVEILTPVRLREVLMFLRELAYRMDEVISGKGVIGSHWSPGKFN